MGKFSDHSTYLNNDEIEVPVGSVVSVFAFPSLPITNPSFVSVKHVIAAAKSEADILVFVSTVIPSEHLVIVTFIVSVPSVSVMPFTGTRTGE